jgi:hypothetical protein
VPGRGSMQCPRALPDPWLAEGCRHIECRDGSRDTKEKGRGRGAGAFSSPKFAPVAGPEHGTLRRSHAAAQVADFRHGMKDHLVANVAPCDRPVEKWRHRFLLARTPDAGPSGGSEPLGKLPMAGIGRGGRRACGPSGFCGFATLPRPARTRVDNDRPAPPPGSTRPDKARVPLGVAMAHAEWSLAPASGAIVPARRRHPLAKNQCRPLQRQGHRASPRVARTPAAIFRLRLSLTRG